MSEAEEKAKVDAWMPLWIGEYLGDTMSLTRDQHGGYLLLLMAYWRNKGPLPDQPEELAAIAKATPEEWATLGPRLARFFILRDGCWVHARADKELHAAEVRRSNAQSKARKAANKRWGKGAADDEAGEGGAAGDASGKAQAKPKQSPPPSPSPTTPNGVGEKTSRKSAKDYTAEFEEAWAAYPSRPGNSKADAFKAWKARIAQGVAPAVMTEGVRAYAAHCVATERDPQYVKQAATFFGPGEHYLADWPATTTTSRPAANSTAARRQSTMAGLTNTGEGNAGHRDDFVDVEARVVDAG